MKYYLLSLTLILSVLMVGCSNSTAILMKEYKGQNLTGKSLTIIKLTALHALGNLEIFKVDDPLKVSCSTEVL